MRLSEILVEKNEPNDKRLWGRAQAEAKKRYKKHPSAYSNSFASKKYKEWGGTWKTVSEDLHEDLRD
jgi:hypothetical protein